MRRHAANGAVIVWVLLFALVASVPTAAAQGATPAPEPAEDALFPEPVDLPELRIRATDTGFEGVPADPNATPAAGATAAPESNASELIATEDGPTPYYFETYQAGGPVAATPGQTVQGIVELPPGAYVVWPDSPFQPLTARSLRVTGELATPAADLGFDPAALVFVGSTQTQSAGTTQWMALNLEPGTYVVACFGFDPANDYQPHVFEGELVVLTVE